MFRYVNWHSVKLFPFLPPKDESNQSLGADVKYDAVVQ